MKKSLGILLAAVMLLSACTEDDMTEQTATENEEGDISYQYATENEEEDIEIEYPIEIEKVDRSVFNEEGLLIGNFFYEKPIIPQTYAGAEKINAYFDKECLEFFEGTPDIYYELGEPFKTALGFLEEHRKYSEEGLVEDPYRFFRETHVTFLSDKYISFRQTDAWMAGGTNDVCNKGMTFNLETGEIEPITTFTDTDTLWGDIYNALLPLSEDCNWLREDLEEAYVKDTDDSFIIVRGKKELDVNKNYFYDGKCVNIVLNDIFFYYPHNGLIFRRNKERIDAKSLYTYFYSYGVIDKGWAN